jgi:hypothetical protein
MLHVAANLMHDCAQPSLNRSLALILDIRSQVFSSCLFIKLHPPYIFAVPKIFPLLMNLQNLHGGFSSKESEFEADFLPRQSQRWQNQWNQASGVYNGGHQRHRPMDKLVMGRHYAPDLAEKVMSWSRRRGNDLKSRQRAALKRYRRRTIYDLRRNSS